MPMRHVMKKESSSSIFFNKLYMLKQGVRINETKMIEKLCRFFDIRKKERYLVFILMLHSLFFGFMLVFFESAAGALFLVNYNADMIPLTYIFGAVVITALGILYSKLEQKFTPMKLFLVTVLLSLASLIAFRVILGNTSAKWPIFVLFLWIDLFAVLFTMEFGGLCGLLCNIQQGKRLFSLIGSGEVLGGIFAGLMVPKLVSRWGTLNLLWASIISMAAIAIILMAINKHYEKQIFLLKKAAKKNIKETKVGGISFKDIFKKNFLLLITLVSACCVFINYFNEYVFYDGAQKQFLDDVALASFFEIGRAHV